MRVIVHGGAGGVPDEPEPRQETLSRRAVRHLERGLDAQTAAETAIEEFGELTGSEAGVVVLDDEGIGRAFDSEGMQTSFAAE